MPDPSAAAFARWLFGQSVALVVCVLWILFLIRNQRVFRQDAIASRQQSEKLSELLLRSIEGALLERLRQAEQHSLQLDSTMRTLLADFTAAVQSRKR